MPTFEFVQWRIMLNTCSQEKAERLVSRVADALGVTICRTANFEDA